MTDRKLSDASGYAWELIKKDGSDSTFIDGQSTELGNWMRYVNHAGIVYDLFLIYLV